MAAVTEMLRAHSVVNHESIAANDYVTIHRWRHSDPRLIKPRPNHVAMDGQTVLKDQPFTLVGRDGVTYFPMYPRDPVLPASESVNCHCLEQGIVDDSAVVEPKPYGNEPTKAEPEPSDVSMFGDTDTNGAPLAEKFNINGFGEECQKILGERCKHLPPKAARVLDELVPDMREAVTKRTSEHSACHNTSIDKVVMNESDEYDGAIGFTFFHELEHMIDVRAAKLPGGGASFSCISSSNEAYDKAIAGDVKAWVARVQKNRKVTTDEAKRFIGKRMAELGDRQRVSRTFCHPQTKPRGSRT